MLKKIIAIVVSAFIITTSACVPKKPRQAIDGGEKIALNITTKYYKENISKCLPKKHLCLKADDSPDFRKIIYLTDPEQIRTSSGIATVYYSYREFLVSLGTKEIIGTSHWNELSALEQITNPDLAESYINIVQLKAPPPPPKFTNDDCRPVRVFNLKYSPEIIEVFFGCWDESKNLCLGRDCGYFVTLDTRNNQIIGSSHQM